MASLEDRERPRSPYDGSEYLSAREIAALLQNVEDKLDNHFEYHKFTEKQMERQQKEAASQLAAKVEETNTARRWFVGAVVSVGTLITAVVQTFYHFNPVRPGH